MKYDEILLLQVEHVLVDQLTQIMSVDLQDAKVITLMQSTRASII